MDINDLLKKQLDEAAWRGLSQEFPWTLETLKKYWKKLDWHLVSNNAEILWTPEMLEEFKNWITWSSLSLTDCDSILTVACLERFADCWDWDKLSENDSIPLDYDTIDRFIDKWNWAELIDHGSWKDKDLGASHLYSYEFLERYASRIPIDALKDSQLWYDIKEQRKKELHRQIACGEV